MSFLPSDKYFQLLFGFTGTAVPTGAAVTFGVGTVSTQTIEEVYDNVWDAWNTSGMKDLMVSTCVLTTIKVKQGPNSTGAYMEVGKSVAGTASGAAGNASSSLLMRKNTGLGGRANRGRMYVPGISEAAVDPGGVIESGYLSSAQTVATQLIENLVSTDGPHAFAVPMVLLHSTSSSQPPEVLSLTVESTVANQRRRQRR